MLWISSNQTLKMKNAIKPPIASNLHIKVYVINITRKSTNENIITFNNFHSLFPGILDELLIGQLEVIKIPLLLCKINLQALLKRCYIITK